MNICVCVFVLGWLYNGSSMCLCGCRVRLCGCLNVRWCVPVGLLACVFVCVVDCLSVCGCVCVRVFVLA